MNTCKFRKFASSFGTSCMLNWTGPNCSALNKLNNNIIKYYEKYLGYFSCVWANKSTAIRPSDNCGQRKDQWRAFELWKMSPTLMYGSQRFCRSSRLQVIIRLRRRDVFEWKRPYYGRKSSFTVDRLDRRICNFDQL